MMRLNKFLAACGLCARREADTLIAQGRVKVNGKTAVLGQMLQEGDAAEVNGRTYLFSEAPHAEPEGSGQETGMEPPVLLAFYKPRGVVCTNSTKDHAPRIADVLHYPYRLFPIGRLDKASEGLLLLTNQGTLAEAISKSKNLHEKEYVVHVRQPLNASFLKRMAEGVSIRLPEKDAAGRGKYVMQDAAGCLQQNRMISVRTRPCHVEKRSSHSFSIILTEGMNRQIRRMCSTLGNEVTALKRVRVMNICLGNLKPGDYRIVTGEELEELRKC